MGPEAQPGLPREPLAAELLSRRGDRGNACLRAILNRAVIRLTWSDVTEQPANGANAVRARL